MEWRWNGIFHMNSMDYSSGFHWIPLYLPEISKYHGKVLLNDAQIKHWQTLTLDLGVNNNPQPISQPPPPSPKPHPHLATSPPPPMATTHHPC